VSNVILQPENMSGIIFIVIFDIFIVVATRMKFGVSS